jgi:hypothetical protein
VQPRQHSARLRSRHRWRLAALLERHLHVDVAPSRLFEAMSL